MKKKIASILIAVMTITSMTMFTGCEEDSGTSVGQASYDLSGVINGNSENEIPSTTEVTETVIPEIPFIENEDVSEEKIETVKNAYLPNCSKMCKELDDICSDVQWKYYESEDYVEFIGSVHAIDLSGDYRILFSVKGD